MSFKALWWPNCNPYPAATLLDQIIYSPQIPVVQYGKPDHSPRIPVVQYGFPKPDPTTWRGCCAQSSAWATNSAEGL